MRMSRRQPYRPLLVAAGAVLVGLALWRRRRRYDLAGRTVLITGGSRGLGLVMARRFAAAGARVAITARHADDLERAVLDLSERGATALAVAADVTDPDQVADLLEAVRARFGPVDVLVNNAGVIEVGPFETMDVADVAASLDVHVYAPLYLIMGVVPEMRQRGGGRIVNISSIGGKVSVPHLLAYSTGKFGLTGLSQGLRAELWKDGIVVTTVCPGLMRTGSPRHAFFKGRNLAEYAWFTLLDSLPFTSISADAAARRIVTACVRGEAEVVLSLQAKAIALCHGLFPGLTADVLGQVNRLLPSPGGIGHARVEGRDSESEVTRSWLTWLTRRAARRNNELAS
jgi:NAD(P)-dependent dehydrogenase (short-subunit alcohol dehydrogenase family)